jgi:hypothetical protein
MSIAIKVDEDLPSEFVNLLQLAGHDAKSVYQQGWTGYKTNDFGREFKKKGAAYSPQGLPTLTCIRTDHMKASYYSVSRVNRARAIFVLRNFY